MFKINNNIVSKLCPSPTLPLSLRLFFVLDFIFMLMSIIMIAVVFIFHRNMSGLMSLYSYLYTVLYFRKDEFNFRVLFATTSIRFIFFLFRVCFSGKKFNCHIGWWRNCDTYLKSKNTRRVKKISFESVIHQEILRY